MPKLRLVRSSHPVPHRGGGRGGPPSSGSGGIGPPRRPHWLADLLFAAISRTHEEQWNPPGERAHGMREVAVRMTHLSTLYLGRYQVIDERMAERVKNVVRCNPFSYGWTIEHVQKGAAGEDRGYFPILVDRDSDDYVWQYMDDDDRDYAKFGAVSSARTILTMIKNQAAAMRLYALTDPDFQAYADACEDLITAADEAAAEAMSIA